MAIKEGMEGASSTGSYAINPKPNSTLEYVVVSSRPQSRS